MKFIDKHAVEIKTIDPVTKVVTWTLKIRDVDRGTAHSVAEMNGLDKGLARIVDMWEMPAVMGIDHNGHQVTALPAQSYLDPTRSQS